MVCVVMPYRLPSAGPLAAWPLGRSCCPFGQVRDLAAARSLPTMALLLDPVTDPGTVAAAASRIVEASRPDMLVALRRELEALLPGRFGSVLAALTPDCPRAPLKIEGAARATGAEVAAIATRMGDDGAWSGRGRLAGADRELRAVAAPAGTVFAFERRDDAPLADAAIDVVAGLCALVAAVYNDRSGETSPQGMAEGLVAARERARTIAELGELHEAALTAILAALRSRTLDDGA